SCWIVFRMQRYKRGVQFICAPASPHLKLDGRGHRRIDDHPEKCRGSNSPAAPSPPTTEPTQAKHFVASAFVTRYCSGLAVHTYADGRRESSGEHRLPKYHK